MKHTEDKPNSVNSEDIVSRRRRWTAEEKKVLVRETYAPGMTVAIVARKYGIGPSQLFNWRKLEREGGLVKLVAGISAVPAVELAAARKQIAELQRMLSRRTAEVQILKEAIECARERKWIARLLLSGREGQFTRSVSL